jgi:hypothetical protein
MRNNCWDTPQLRFAKQFCMKYSKQAEDNEMYFEDIVPVLHQRLPWMKSHYEETNGKGFPDIEDLYERIGATVRRRLMEPSNQSAQTFSHVITPLLSQMKIITWEDVTALLPQEKDPKDVPIRQFLYAIPFTYRQEVGYKFGVTSRWFHRPPQIAESYRKVRAEFSLEYHLLVDVGTDRQLAESLEAEVHEEARHLGGNRILTLKGEELFWISAHLAMTAIIKVVSKVQYSFAPMVMWKPTEIKNEKRMKKP